MTEKKVGRVHAEHLLPGKVDDIFIISWMEMSMETRRMITLLFHIKETPAHQQILTAKHG